jgi:serine/threonine protein kinase
VATSAPSPSESLPSRPQLGAYRVLGTLGRGGMAHVLKVEHLRLGQIRALKVLLPELTAPHIVGRLMTEARAMARLRHPAIVEVFDCDVLEDGTAFIAMEYLRGEQMRRWLDRVGKVRGQPMLAAAIVGAIGQGLLYAHQHEIVHRDLKPENILLVPDPSEPRNFAVKILDFGIAKLMREEPLTRTRAGCVVGTPVYMAPEQWRPGSKIDPRTDIYALGCVFFELLCGRPPFVENDDVDMRRAHLEDAAPAVTSLEPDLPAALDPLIGRMLAKAPEDRPQSVEEVLLELEAVTGHTRARFAELLRVPASWSVIAKETVTVDPAATRHTRLSPVGWAPAAFPFATDAWQGRGDPRKRFAILVALGAMAAIALVGGVLLWLREPAAAPVARPAPPPAVAAPAPPEPAPVPTQTPARAGPADRSGSAGAAPEHRVRRKATAERAPAVRPAVKPVVERAGADNRYRKVAD